ncbi:hypothetical protein [Thermococcus sp. MV11]|uniref:hypothetical protein n=1 Tax=Thermococcus sp. MV11 TaxID=1638267 RepID=UPI0014319798|nr:hypothetical protein [Thermococcus sp. MV11]NJE02565.1 hypothetical protein [Thermococcus sp. MV11]
MKRAFPLFALLWFVFATWGLELGVAFVYKTFAGSLTSLPPTTRLEMLWTITILRALAVAILLRWLGLNWRELFAGRFGARELALSTAVVLAFLLLELVYSGWEYTPQAIGEFRYYLSLSGGRESLAAVLFASQYAYYFVEILAVNLLYAGSLRLAGERAAVVAPTLLWGLAHAINGIAMPLQQAVLLGLYVGLFAFAMYSLCLKSKSMKVPLYIWFANLAV